MTDILSAEDDIEPSIDWSRLGHVYVVANGKGGVGKTTTTVHIAALVASDGARTLIVDLNGQGNISQLLGFAGTEVDDQGRGLFTTLTTGIPLQPVRAVRPNLDVVPGGHHVRQVAGALAGKLGNPREAAKVFVALAAALEKISADYDLIVIDTPPENPLLLDLALCASRFVIVPMRTDLMSRKGLRELAREIRDMRDINPYIVLLAVFVFGSSSASKKIRRELSEAVAADLGQSKDLMLSSFIRQSEAVAQELAKFGLLAFELEQEIANNPKHWEVRRGTATNTTKVSETSRSVAEDFAKLAAEIFTRAGIQQQKMNDEGNWP